MVASIVFSKILDEGNMFALLYNLRVYVQIFALVGLQAGGFPLQERIIVYSRVFVQ